MPRGPFFRRAPRAPAAAMHQNRWIGGYLGAQRCTDPRCRGAAEADNSPDERALVCAPLRDRTPQGSRPSLPRLRGGVAPARLGGSRLRLRGGEGPLPLDRWKVRLLSREHADWELLRKRGRMKGM